MLRGRKSRASVVVLAAACLLLTACHQAPSAGAPSVEFSTIPEAAVGGSDRLAPIAGRVRGAQRGQSIVLFAKTNVWWVQPLAAEPFTKIEDDSTWKSNIHLGTEYAALLVDPGYAPPATTESLPQPGGRVRAVATVRGTGDFASRPPRTLTFQRWRQPIDERRVRHLHDGHRPDVEHRVDHSRKR
jgi:hypothetical protein